MNADEYKLHQGVKIWNILASLLFILLCLGMYFVYTIIHGNIFEFNYFDIFILIFAIHRLVRIFVYDNMTLFFRELFLDLKIENGKYEYVTSKNSFKVTFGKLTLCPWCFGVWLAFVSGFFYFTFPVFKVFFILLAISSIASLLIIFTNLIGWYAEGKKREVENK